MLVARAQIISVLLFAVLLWLLSWRARGRGWAAAIIGLLCVWANVHGALLVGIAAVIAVSAPGAVRALLSRRVSADLAVVALAPFTALVTPYGLKIVDYYRSILFNDGFTVISEWYPLMFSKFQHWPTILAIGAVSGVPLTHIRQVRVGEIALFALLVVQTAEHWRSGIWMALFGLWMCARLLRPADDGPVSRRARVLGTALV
jgi:hypothetical protein